MSSTSPGLVRVDDGDVFTFSPKSAGDHVIKCTAVNNVFGNLKSEGQYTITAQGIIYVVYVVYMGYIWGTYYLVYVVNM